MRVRGTLLIVAIVSIASYISLRAGALAASILIADRVLLTLEARGVMNYRPQGAEPRRRDGRFTGCLVAAGCG